MTRWIRSLLAAVGVSLLAACGGGDGNEPTVRTRVLDNPQYSILASALNTAGLTETLGGNGPFTLFAPTDAAFAALLSELGLTQAQLFADRALLTQVLTYHVVAGNVPRASVPVGRAITTLQGSVFKVSAVGSGLAITDGRNRVVPISATDLAATNGVIHTVDRVLLPPNLNIVQTAQAAPQFSILVQAAINAGLVNALSAPGPLTVFAPTDTAFAALLAELNTTADALLADTALLTRVLSYHVVPGRVLAADIVAGAPITTLQGGSFSVGAGNRITDARARQAGIVATDVFATNGVIHVIDRVLLPLPAENIVALAQGNSDFSILVQAVINAGLVDALSAPGPFTVFAPTNAAFAALLAERNLTAEQLLGDTALLTRVLTYHVVPGRVLAAQIVPGTPITTLQGGTFSISPALAITDGAGRQSGIAATDVFASNGVIHVIDRVLLPPPAP